MWDTSYWENKKHKLKKPSSARCQGEDTSDESVNCRVLQVGGKSLDAEIVTLCSVDSLALGGGGHFALYLEGDLLHGSSSSSHTFGNSCLAHTEDFELKDVELWGFVYASKYPSRAVSYNEPQEAPGVNRYYNTWS